MGCRPRARRARGAIVRRVTRPGIRGRGHHRWAPPPRAVAAIAPDYYNVLIPNPWDTLYDHIVVDHFRSPTVTGFYNPEAPPPSWHGVLPYRIRTGDAVLQYDGVIGRYVPLAQADAALIAAAVPPPPPPR